MKDEFSTTSCSIYIFRYALKPNLSVVKFCDCLNEVLERRGAVCGVPLHAFVRRKLQYCKLYTLHTQLACIVKVIFVFYFLRCFTSSSLHGGPSGQPPGLSHSLYAISRRFTASSKALVPISACPILPCSMASCSHSVASMT
jgi:hypothetical protein